MRRSQRLIAAAVLVVFSSVLAGCSSGFGDFDPTDLLDFLDTKKKLPGKREEVFPGGVPGLEQGVPKELYKGAQQQDDPNAQALAAPPQQPQAQQPQAQQPQARQQPLEPPPGSPQAIKRAKAKAKAEAKGQGASTAAAEPDGEAAAASQADGTQAAPPPHKKKIARRRTTAPPPDPDAQPQAAAPQQSSQPAQAAQQPFPAPLPGGSFSR